MLSVKKRIRGKDSGDQMNNGIVHKTLKICEEIQSTGEINAEPPVETIEISIGDLIDTRNTNKDFRRFVGRVREINEKEGTFLIEYADGELKPYKISKNIRIFSRSNLQRFIRIMEKNMENGAMKGPTIEKVYKKLQRWLEKYNKK